MFEGLKVDNFLYYELSARLAYLSVPPCVGFASWMFDGMDSKLLFDEVPICYISIMYYFATLL